MNLDELNERIWRKANDTFTPHSRGYTERWGVPYYQNNPAMTGDFKHDCQCSPLYLARDMRAAWDNGCPFCGRSFVAMAAGKKGIAGDPFARMHFHVQVPAWTVVCSSCHPRIEGKPAKEWEALKRWIRSQLELFAT